MNNNKTRCALSGNNVTEIFFHGQLKKKIRYKYLNSNLNSFDIFDNHLLSVIVFSDLVKSFYIRQRLFWSVLG